MAEQSVSTPQSSNENSGPKIAKDRSCPFCGQAFTSSSLGRHLDLYIKPKNSKPPDGIHDVDEIRRMRGNITRRQSRISGSKRDSSTPAPIPNPVQSATATVRQILEGNAATQVATSPSTSTKFEEKLGVRFNRPGWESTGVMNDLPPRLEPKSNERRDVVKHHLLKADLEQRHKIAEELETGRAAELALQEVLGSVRDASTWYSGRGLFEFDFFTFNFPALCLKILPAPLTIHSATPFPTDESWPLEAPNQSQYDALKRAVEDRARVAQRQWQARPMNSASMPSEISDLTKFHAHITDAYQHWMSLREPQRQETWRLEILRAYTCAEEDRRESQSTIASLRRQIDHLSSNLERANNGWGGISPQNQSPFSPFSPLTSLRLSDDLMKELCKQGVDLQGWDYARLIDKWKIVVKEERKALHGLSAQKRLDGSEIQNHLNTAPHQPLNGVTRAARSTSTASAFSGAEATRTNSMDSHGDADLDADADEDAEGEADHDEEENLTETEHTSHQQPSSRVQRSLPQGSPLCRNPVPGIGSHWSMSPQNIPAPPSRGFIPGVTKLPPDEWRREVSHAMEGVESSSAN